MSNNMDAHSAESSNSSIKVTASSSAPIMRHTVEVGEAATTAYLIGTNQLTRLGSASQTSSQLKDVMFSDLTSSGLSVTFTENGSRVTKSKNDVAFSFSVGDGVNSSGNTSTDKDVATAKADSSSTSGEYKVNITSMESKAALTSNGITRTDSSTSEDIKNIAFKSVTNNGDGTYTFVNLAGAGSGAGPTTVAESDLSTTNAIQFTIGDGSGSTKTISFTYQDVLDGNATLSNLADKINAAGLNLTASYDADNDEFSIVNNNVGSDNTVDITLARNETNNKVGTNTAKLLSSMNLVNNAGVASSTLNLNPTGTNTLSSVGAYAQGTINGNSVTFDANNNYTNTDTGITFAAAGTGETTIKIDADTIKKNTISVTYGDLLNGYSFNDLASDVNNMNLNTRATYDAVNDKFAFYNKETGKANTIELTVADAGKGGTLAAKFLNDLGLKQSANGELSEDAFTFTAGESTVAAGTNAEVKIDGIGYDFENNKTTVDGVTYDFTNATKGSTAVVTVDQDTDKIVDYVKNFIKDYNELLSSLYKAYDEKPNSSYKPLTDAQKDQMTEEQIEKWEEKAKAGMLYHDRTLGKVIDNIRSAITTKIDGVSGSYDSIFSIGISTTGLRGQLVLDEDKLKSAMSSDAESVYNVFAKLEYNTDATSASGKLQQEADNFAKSGIAQRLSDVLNSGLKSVKSVSGSNSSISEDSDINNLMRELQTKMSNFKAMMNAFENKLYKKYDAMETMLAGLGVQLNYVTSAFA